MAVERPALKEAESTSQVRWRAQRGALLQAAPRQEVHALMIVSVRMVLSVSLEIALKAAVSKVVKKAHVMVAEFVILIHVNASSLLVVETQTVPKAHIAMKRLLSVRADVGSMRLALTPLMQMVGRSSVTLSLASV
jgi:hypothetical protein